MVAAVAAVTVLVAGCGSSTSPKAQKAAARSWIKQRHDDWNNVRVSVQGAQAGIQILKKDATEGALNQFAQLAQQSHDSIDSVRKNFALPSDSGKLGNAETEVFDAANRLKNSMGALVKYTGNPNPATLASFTTQYQPAVAEWDAGIKKIWRIAHRKHPPTL
jgi:hypothetical protein